VLVRRGGRYDALLATYEYQAFLPESDPLRAVAANARDRVVAEARRNARENPRGFAAIAVLCLDGEVAACDKAHRLAAARPELYRLVARLRALRAAPR
jgi:hypothetical protein